MMSFKAGGSDAMSHMIALLYGSQSLSELSGNIAGSAHTEGSGLTKLLEAKDFYAAGASEKGTQVLVDLVSESSPDTRVRLWAAKALRDRGMMPEGPAAVEAQGIVMEVPVGSGADVLAVYRDGTARYLSHSNAVAVYDGNRSRATDLCRKIVAAAQRIVSSCKGYRLSPDAPKVTVLTLSGPIVAGSESPIDEPLRLGAALVGELASARLGR